MLFDINGETYFMYQGIFDTDFDKYTEDAVAIFSTAGIDTVFENLEGFPEGLEDEPRRHSSSSSASINARASSNTAEYPYVSADEIKKALRLKAAFSDDARPDAIIQGRRACSNSTTSSTSC